MRKRTAAVILVALVAAIAALPVFAATPKLQGTDGPGFTITMKTKPTKAGKYVLVVSDKSNIHNFHLSGPGVNVKTGVGFVGTKSFTITLKKGKYNFICDPHATIMKGSFTIK
ncbi:MAG TPA: plastocyanin/azurin family copper-binding protein [Gaiellaceae bacterium]|jgi:plastocyanin|nr:plastocyanin/azurin family copper-binding protein [Gaiellaceae bacterium]